MVDKLIGLMLRLPPDVHTAVTLLAKAEHRSLNSQLIVLLKEALTARQRKSR